MPKAYQNQFGMTVPIQFWDNMCIEINNDCVDYNPLN